MRRRRDADADAPGAANSEGANGDLMAGGQDRVQSIALPVRPKLSDAGERLLGQLKPGDYRPLPFPAGTPRLPHVGDLTVTGQLTMKVPKSAMPWEIRRSFSSLGHLPDGVTVVVKLRARQVVDLADALGGLDNLPQITLVVTGPVHRFQAVADAVIALRTSGARRAAELRAVAG